MNSECLLCVKATEEIAKKKHLKKLPSIKMQISLVKSTRFRSCTVYELPKQRKWPNQTSSSRINCN